MEKKASQLRNRLLDFSVSSIKICLRLKRTEIGRHIGGQLLRAGTSVGANYEEACGAFSRADFIYKLTIAYKEIRESIYWLKLILHSELLRDDSVLHALSEAQELRAIIGKSVKTAKGLEQPIKNHKS
jgi:four helix bundle protein